MSNIDIYNAWLYLTSSLSPSRLLGPFEVVVVPPQSERGRIRVEMHDRATGARGVVINWDGPGRKTNVFANKNTITAHPEVVKQMIAVRDAIQARIEEEINPMLGCELAISPVISHDEYPDAKWAPLYWRGVSRSPIAIGLAVLACVDACYSVAAVSVTSPLGTT